jgi:hypothetical protein
MLSVGELEMGSGLIIDTFDLMEPVGLHGIRQGAADTVLKDPSNSLLFSPISLDCPAL